MKCFRTKQIRTQKGEIVHLVMEKMHPKFGQYKDSAQLLLSGGNKFVGGTFGSIQELYDAHWHKPGGIEAFLDTRTVPGFWGKKSSTTLQFFAEIGAADFRPDSSKTAELKDVTNAASGMNVHSQTHIAYATKTAPTGPYFEQPLSTIIKDDGDELVSAFELFHAKYDNIIMSVGVTVGEFHVENRGIFRNPLSVVKNDNRRIAMQLHRFTCECVSKHWPDVEIFRVRPMQKMAHIFMKSLPTEQVTINGRPASEYNGTFASEETFAIPISVMLAVIEETVR